MRTRHARERDGRPHEVAQHRVGHRGRRGPPPRHSHRTRPGVQSGGDGRRRPHGGRDHVQPARHGQPRRLHLPGGGPDDAAALPPPDRCPRGRRVGGPHLNAGLDAPAGLRSPHHHGACGQGTQRRRTEQDPARDRRFRAPTPPGRRRRSVACGDAHRLQRRRVSTHHPTCRTPPPERRRAPSAQRLRVAHIRIGRAAGARASGRPGQRHRHRGRGRRGSRPHLLPRVGPPSERRHGHLRLRALRRGRHGARGQVLRHAAGVATDGSRR